MKVFTAFLFLLPFLLGSALAAAMEGNCEVFDEVASRGRLFASFGSDGTLKNDPSKRPDWVNTIEGRVVRNGPIKRYYDFLARGGIMRGAPGQGLQLFATIERHDQIGPTRGAGQLFRFNYWDATKTRILKSYQVLPNRPCFAPLGSLKETDIGMITVAYRQGDS